MNRWIARGLLVSGILSISMVAMASARAAAVMTSSTALSGADSARVETSLGNLVADALRLASKAEVALVPANVIEEKELALTASAPDAVRKILAAPPSEPIMVVRVTGKDLQSALNRSLALFPRKNRGFLQVSGLTLSFDPSVKEGDKIVSVRVNGAALDPNKTYTVAMPESMAKGGLGYFNLWEVKDAKVVTDPKGAKVSLLDAVLARMKEGKASAATDGRIRSTRPA